jgi:hypothetical protein
VSDIKPPYPKHGEPIPKSMGRGEWIAENLFFLSFDDQETAPPGPQGTYDLNATVPSPGGGMCLRFGAARVAKAMGITVEKLIKINRSGKLLAAAWAVPPQPGDNSAMRFRLYSGTRFFEITIGTSKAAGTA